LALSQTIFDGNKTTSSVNAAEARVLAARETLRATETQVLSDAVGAYTTLVRDAQIVDLRSQHVRILERDTAAVRSQHRIGDKTLTDVAQAEARLAAARSAYDVAVVGLRASKATLRRIIGSDAVDPSEPGVPTADLPKTMEDAVTTGLTENPTLLAAIHRERAARFDIDIARSEFLPKFTFDAVTRSRKEENRLVDFHSETSVTGTIVVPR
jgi:outer membrane protein